jgi:hypothetical protein
VEDESECAFMDVIDKIVEELKRLCLLFCTPSHNELEPSELRSDIVGCNAIFGCSPSLEATQWLARYEHLSP